MHLFKHLGLALAAGGALIATSIAAATASSSGNDQNVTEGKREAKEWFEDGHENENEEAAECEAILESKEWELEDDKTHEEYFSEWQEEISEGGGSGTEGAREGRIEWMRENKENQDGPPRPKDGVSLDDDLGESGVANL